MWLNADGGEFPSCAATARRAKRDHQRRDRKPGESELLMVVTITCRRLINIISVDQDQSVTLRLSAASNANRRPFGAPAFALKTRVEDQEVAPSTVTARRFCDQHEMSLQTATGRSLP